MKIRELVSKLALYEGKKHEAPVGDVRELVSLISDLIYKDEQIALELYLNGKRRAKRKKK